MGGLSRRCRGYLERRMSGESRSRRMGLGEIMARYLLERQRAIWQFLPNLSTEENVKVLLTKMACFRQAKMDSATLELFTAYLAPLDLRAFQVAMATISESERLEGETAFPSLGIILAAMDEAREFSPNFAIGAREINDRPAFGEQPMRRLK